MVDCHGAPHFLFPGVERVPHDRTVGRIVDPDIDPDLRERGLSVGQDGEGGMVSRSVAADYNFIAHLRAFRGGREFPGRFVEV